MKFTRVFKPDEVKLFDDLVQDINSIIDKIIKQRVDTCDVRTVESRILKLLSRTKPMTVTGIMDAHNAVHSDKSIALNYARSVLSRMVQSCIIIRTGRGLYVKGGK